MGIGDWGFEGGYRGVGIWDSLEAPYATAQ